MVPTLGHKSTNMQSTELHNHAGQQYSSRHLVWRQHAMPLQAVTSFLGWSFHQHWPCQRSLYVQHASCFDMSVCVRCVHLYFTSPTLWQWRYQFMHITVNAVFPSQDTGKQTSLTATFFTVQCRSTNEEAHAPNLCLYKRIFVSFFYTSLTVHLVTILC